MPLIAKIMLGGCLGVCLVILVGVILLCREIVKPDHALEHDRAEASHLLPDGVGSLSAPEGERGTNLLSPL